MKRIIGRREKISLIDWGIRSVSAKVDTGAYTSSIHCKYFKEKEIEGKKILEFIIFDPLDPLYNGQVIETQDFSKKSVKNSFGQTELRYKVNSKIAIFGEELEIEFTLSDRSEMRSPILLGRKILYGRFLVDVEGVNFSQKFLKAQR